MCQSLSMHISDGWESIIFVVPAMCVRLEQGQLWNNVSIYIIVGWTTIVVAPAIRVRVQ